MELWAVVVAGGSGTRFGRPKQLELLGGHRIIDRSIAALKAHVVGVVVVGSEDVGTPESLMVDSVVPGGATRSDSVRSGLAALPPQASHVLVHDAARPLVTSAVVGRVVDSLAAGATAVVPVVPVVDTLRHQDGHPVDRNNLVAVQTPQGFGLSQLRSAHADGGEATDDASLIENQGGIVAHVEGTVENLKITYPSDLAIAETILRLRNGAPGGQSFGEGTVAERPVAEMTREGEVDDATQSSHSRPVDANMMRIGQGFDVHPWSDDDSRTLILGGVAFPEMRGLAGHSDADAIAHACTDAILGATGIGDIGQMFPDTEAGLADANSVELLAQAAAEVVRSGWSIVNIDCTVILDEPKIAPVRDQIVENLRVAVGAPVTVKGKRTEGLSDLQQGVRCHAVALVAKTDVG